MAWTCHLPLTLRLRAKSTTQSYRTPVYLYVDSTLRDELTPDRGGRSGTASDADDEAMTIREMETVARALLRKWSVRRKWMKRCQCWRSFTSCGGRGIHLD